MSPTITYLVIHLLWILFLYIVYRVMKRRKERYDDAFYKWVYEDGPRPELPKGIFPDRKNEIRQSDTYRYHREDEDN